MWVREGGERKKSVWCDKVRTELEISKSLEDIFVKKMGSYGSEPLP